VEIQMEKVEGVPSWQTIESWFLSVLLAVAIAPAVAYAQPGLPDAADRERLARQVETEVIAPCCWSQQVSEHESPAATEIRADIRRRLAAGQTHDQILDAYVAEYGQRILAVPPASGFNYLLFAVPPLLFFATAILVIGFVRRASRRGQATLATAPANRPADTEPGHFEHQLDDELRDLD
jgi:cytochrome c-type biogenesis protein CcmH